MYQSEAESMLNNISTSIFPLKNLASLFEWEENEVPKWLYITFRESFHSKSSIHFPRLSSFESLELHP